MRQLLQSALFRHGTGIIVKGFAAFVTPALLLSPAAALAQSWSMYDGYTQSYTIPYTTNYGPTYSDSQTSMWLNAAVGLPGTVGQTIAKFQVDTGSTGMVVPSYMVPGYVPSGPLQKHEFSSSGNYAMGTWAVMTVTFTDGSRINGALPTAQVPVFIEQTAHYSNGNVNDCSSQTGGAGCIFQLGIGYGRPGAAGDSGPTGPTINPLLNIAGMTGANPTIRAGYLISSTGITAGLTAQNAGSGFAYVKLQPSATTSGDWQTLPGQFFVNGHQVVGNDTTLLDTGLSYLWSSFGGHVTPTNGHCPDSVQNSSPNTLCAPGGTAFTVVLGSAGNPNTISYSYVEGHPDSNPDVEPWYSRSNEILGEVNTGIHAFAGFTYFFDAAGGYVGFTPQEGADVIFNASLSVIGSLQLSSGFSADIPVYVAGDTILSNPDMAVFAGTVTGASDGSLNIAGPGTIAFTGNVTLPAGITVSGGSLSLGAATAADIQVLSQGSLTNTGTLTGGITNAGAFLNSGTVVGSLTNSGVAGNLGTIQGAVANSGIFSNDGTVTGNVSNSGLLVGNGTIGGNLTSTGNIAPGHSIGVIHVVGDATLEASARYVAEIGPSGAADMLQVDGTLTSNGATLQLMPLAGFNPMIGSSYVIMNAGSVTGTFVTDLTGFGAASSLYPFMAGATEFVGNTLEVTLVRSAVPFSALAVTPNQQAAAGAADTLATSGALAGALASVSGAAAPAAFTQIDGETYPSTLAILQAQSAYVRNAVTSRLLQATPGAPVGTGPNAVDMPGISGATLWAQAYAGWGSNDGNFNATGTSSSIGGFLIGLDTKLADWRVGLAAGFSQSQYNLTGGYSSGESDNYDLALYAGRSFGPVNLRLGAAYTWHDLSSQRTVALPGLVQSYSAGYGGDTAQVFGELGYGIAIPGLGVPAGIEPFVGLSYVSAAVDGFSETGAAALTGASSSLDAFSSTLGARGTLAVTAGTVPVSLTATLGWQHAYGNLTPQETLAFAAGSSTFTTYGTPLASDMFILAAGLSAQVGQNVTLGVSYNGQLSSEVTENAVKGSLLWAF